MSVCSQCGGFIRWIKEGHRWRGLNADDSEHWSECSRRRMRQVRATGERFDNETEGGYRKSVHGTKLTWMTAGVQPANGPICSLACEIPPWESCTSCPEGLGVMP